jgi:hypothetical protein
MGFALALFTIVVISLSSTPAQSPVRCRQSIYQTSMFKSLVAIFSHQIFKYNIPCSKEYLIEQLDELFNRSNISFAHPNLKGKFVDYPHTFFVEQRWVAFHVSGTDKKPALLKGVISESKAGKLTIEIAVKPNLVFLLSFLISVIYGAILFVKYLRLSDNTSLFGSLWLILGMAPIIVLLASSYTRRLRRSFESYLRVQQSDHCL